MRPTSSLHALAQRRGTPARPRATARRAGRAARGRAGRVALEQPLERARAARGCPSCSRGGRRRAAARPPRARSRATSAATRASAARAPNAATSMLGDPGTDVTQHVGAPELDACRALEPRSRTPACGTPPRRPRRGRRAAPRAARAAAAATSRATGRACAGRTRCAPAGQRAQEPRHEHQMVVVHPHDVVGPQVTTHHLGEPRFTARYVFQSAAAGGASKRSCSTGQSVAFE